MVLGKERRGLAGDKGEEWGVRTGCGPASEAGTTAKRRGCPRRFRFLGRRARTDRTGPKVT